MNNHLLGTAGYDAAPDFSPEFAVVIGGFPTPALDEDSAIAATAYGPELWAALPITGLPTWAFFEQTPDEAVVEVVPLAAPELVARIEQSRASVVALSPPEEYAADHAVIVEYFDALLELQRDVIAAAEAGDIDAVRTAIRTEASDEIWCAVATALSDEVLPAARYFGTPDDLPPFCSP